MQITAGGPGEQYARTAAIRAMQGDGLMLYALRRPDGWIKIGCSSDVVERIRHIRHTEILGLRRATREDERAIHHLLAPHAVEGREVYEPTREVLTVVNDMRTDLGLPPL